MMNRLVMLRTALALAATLILFLSSTQASWHWYYLRIQQHHAMAYQYQQQVHQHHMNVYLNQVHHLNNIRQQIQNHVHTATVHPGSTHVQQYSHHYRNTGIQHIQPRRLIQHETEHERRETHYVLKPRHVDSPGRCLHPRKPWEIHVRTVREDWKKKETHRTIHEPPRHTTTEYRRLAKQLKKEPPRPQPEEHVAKQQKTATKVQTHQDKVVVVRSHEKTEIHQGKKEWDTYLLLKVYYWTDDGHPRALPKPRPESPKPLATAPPGLPVTLPVVRPDLERTLPQPGPHPIDKAIQRQQQAPRLAMSLPKPATPAPQRFVLTAPRMPSPLPVTIPTPAPVRKAMPAIVPVRLMLLSDDLNRTSDFPPLFPAVAEPGKPAEEKPEKRAKEERRVAKVERGRDRALPAEPAVPGLFLPAMRDAEANAPQRVREPAASVGDERFNLLLPGLRPDTGRERSAGASGPVTRVGDAATDQVREREAAPTSRDESRRDLTLLDDGNALAPLFPAAAASLLRLPAEG